MKTILNNGRYTSNISANDRIKLIIYISNCFLEMLWFRSYFQEDKFKVTWNLIYLHYNI